jgi:Cof subfamily protein (haloacid dehalogenase superfamily)
MLEQKIKLIALDLDGTLLSSAKTLGGLSKRILTKLYEKGVNITLSTGRAFHHTQHVSALLGFPVHLICADGAYILPQKHKDPILKPFPAELFRQISKLLRSHLPYVYLLTEDQIWCQDSQKANKKIYGWGNQLFTTGPELIHDLQVLQVIYINTTPEADTFYRFLKEKMPLLAAELSPSLEPGYSQITIRPPGVNKGSALETLAKLLGIKLEESVVFGDWLNDLPMLEKGGLAVTPANSVDEVKAAADIVSVYTSDEDFVGRELARLLSEKKIIA